MRSQVSGLKSEVELCTQRRKSQRHREALGSLVELQTLGTNHEPETGKVSADMPNYSLRLCDLASWRLNVRDLKLEN